MPPALLVIDMQNGVLDDAYRLPEVTGNILDAIAQARADGAPVVWVQHTDADLPQGSPQWALIPSLAQAQREGDLHIFKRYGDSFADTPLHGELQRLGVTEVRLCGAQSEACVTATLWGALHRGYGVGLLAGAHTTVDSEFEGVPLSAAQIVALTNLRASRSRLPAAAAALV